MTWPPPSKKIMIPRIVWNFRIQKYIFPSDFSLFIDDTFSFRVGWLKRARLSSWIEYASPHTHTHTHSHIHMHTSTHINTHAPYSSRKSTLVTDAWVVQRRHTHSPNSKLKRITPNKNVTRPLTSWKLRCWCTWAWGERLDEIDETCGKLTFAWSLSIYTYISYNREENKTHPALDLNIFFSLKIKIKTNIELTKKNCQTIQSFTHLVIKKCDDFSQRQAKSDEKPVKFCDSRVFFFLLRKKKLARY